MSPVGLRGCLWISFETSWCGWIPSPFFRFLAAFLLRLSSFSFLWLRPPFVLWVCPPFVLRVRLRFVLRVERAFPLRLPLFSSLRVFDPDIWDSTSCECLVLTTAYHGCVIYNRIPMVMPLSTFGTLGAPFPAVGITGEFWENDWTESFQIGSATCISVLQVPMDWCHQESRATAVTLSPCGLEGRHNWNVCLQDWANQKRSLLLRQHTMVLAARGACRSGQWFTPCITLQQSAQHVECPGGAGHTKKEKQALYAAAKQAVTKESSLPGTAGLLLIEYALIRGEPYTSLQG
ncbi:hypothetical protein NDU88_004293 [Pleurodeles waltl]|uniref:Uncharacterized protein n=1 Tax=Pleurodeles waltl TaxID=8319 RepID=A0AAV7NN15_PLEWA|nr:hypothetical protein NDU88_004293 [Pleurodeles waltl]